jgi:hypothetical protein
MRRISFAELRRSQDPSTSSTLASAATLGTSVPACPCSRCLLPGRQCVEGARGRCGVAVGDQRGKLGRPPAELGNDPRRHSCAIGHIGAGEPVLRRLELYVGVQSAPSFPTRLPQISEQHCAGPVVAYSPAATAAAAWGVRAGLV